MPRPASNQAFPADLVAIGMAAAEAEAHRLNELSRMLTGDAVLQYAHKLRQTESD